MEGRRVRLDKGSETGDGSPLPHDCSRFPSPPCCVGTRVSSSKTHKTLGSCMNEHFTFHISLQEERNFHFRRHRTIVCRPTFHLLKRAYFYLKEVPNDTLAIHAPMLVRFFIGARRMDEQHDTAFFVRKYTGCALCGWRNVRQSVTLRSEILYMLLDFIPLLVYSRAY